MNSQLIEIPWNPKCSVKWLCYTTEVGKQKQNLVFQFHRKHKLSLWWSSRETSLLSSAVDTAQDWNSREPAWLNSSSGAIAGHGQWASFVPTTVARQTKQLVPCVAWRDSFWHAQHPASSQPRHFKWVISESQLRLLTEALWYASPQTKPLHKYWVKGWLRLYRYI